MASMTNEEILKLAKEVTKAGPERAAAMIIDKVFTDEELQENAQEAAIIYGLVLDIFSERGINPLVGTTVSLMLGFTADEIAKDDRKDVSPPKNVPKSVLDALMRQTMKEAAGKIGKLAFDIHMAKNYK